MRKAIFFLITPAVFVANSLLARPMGSFSDTMGNGCSSFCWPIIKDFFESHYGTSDTVPFDAFGALNIHMVDLTATEICSWQEGQPICKSDPANDGVPCKTGHSDYYPYKLMGNNCVDCSGCVRGYYGSR